jgi:TRAP-type mannitol/chloroaromatic compound transport system permease small subunit
MSSIFTRLDQALERLYLWAGYAAAFFMVTIGVCVLTSIIARALQIYIAGISEYSGYAMAASSFLALAHTFRAGGHIRVALLRSRLGNHAKFWLELWCLAVASLMSCYLAWYIIKLTWVSYKFEEKSEGAAATLLWYPQTLVAIGAVIFAISVVHGLVRVIVRRDAEAAAAGPQQLTVE